MRNLIIDFGLNLGANIQRQKHLLGAIGHAHECPAYAVPENLNIPSRLSREGCVEMGTESRTDSRPATRSGIIPQRAIEGGTDVRLQLLLDVGIFNSGHAPIIPGTKNYASLIIQAACHFGFVVGRTGRMGHQIGDELRQRLLAFLAGGTNFNTILVEATDQFDRLITILAP